jgi:ATP-dependent DNA ligase
MAWIDVMDITKWSISGSEKSVPAKDQQSKRLRCAAIVPNYGHYVAYAALPPGFIAPCLPTKTDKLASGSQWLHEIKHDGFRIIARKNGDRVRLYSRPGNDLTYRFPLIVEALSRLRSRSCIVDGEAVACDDDGMPSLIASGTADTTPAFSCTPST